MTMRVEFNPHKVDVLLYQLAGYSFIRKFLKPTDIVLDVGCGEGYTTKFLSEKCEHICGIDEDYDIAADNNEKYMTPKCHFLAIDILRFKRCPVRFHNARKESGGKKHWVPTNNYDVIVCRDLIEHMTAKRGDSLISKLLDLLKDKTSILFLGTVRKSVVSNRPREQGHIHEYTPYELKTLLELAFERVVFFSQTDEVVSLVEPKEMCWRWIVMCWGRKE